MSTKIMTHIRRAAMAVVPVNPRLVLAGAAIAAGVAFAFTPGPAAVTIIWNVIVDDVATASHAVFGSELPVDESADTSACFWSPESNAWLSEYSTTGMCTFGAPLDSQTPDWNTGEPEDTTVCSWDGSQWVSAYSGTLGAPCTSGR